MNKKYICSYNRIEEKRIKIENLVSLFDAIDALKCLKSIAYQPIDIQLEVWFLERIIFKYLRIYNCYVDVFIFYSNLWL